MRMLVVVALVVVAVAGCAPSNSKIAKSWIGHTQDELIAKWGPPAQQMPDGRGGQILFYVNGGARIQRGATIDLSGTGQGAFRLPDIVRQFERWYGVYTDAGGTIYRVTWGGS